MSLWKREITPPWLDALLIGGRNPARRAAFLERFGILGKDAIQHSKIHLMAAGCFLFFYFLLGTLNFFFDPMRAILYDGDIHFGIIQILLFLIGAMLPFVCAVQVTGDDIIKNTSPFLRRLPLSPFQLWFWKLGTALFVLTRAYLVLGIVYLAIAVSILQLFAVGSANAGKLFPGLDGHPALFGYPIFILTIFCTGFSSGAWLGQTIWGIIRPLVITSITAMATTAILIKLGPGDGLWRLDQMILWCSLLILLHLYLSLLYYRLERKASWGGGQVSYRDTRARKIGKGLNPKRRLFPLNPGVNKLLPVIIYFTVPLFLAAGLICYFLSRFFFMSRNEHGIYAAGFIFVTIGLCAFIGACGLYPSERVAPKFFLHSLPFDAGRFFLGRALLVGLLSFGLALVGGFAALMFEPGPLRFMELGRQEYFVILSLMFGFVHVAISAGLYGLFYRSFYDVALVALVFSVIHTGGLAAVLWIGIAGAGYWDLLTGENKIIFQYVKSVIVLFGFPAGASWLTWHHSILLELPERRRQVMGVLSGIILFVWSAFILIV